MHDGTREYLVRWKPVDALGAPCEPYPDWWLPAARVTKADVDRYEARLAGIADLSARQPLLPVVAKVRSMVAQTVSLDRTACRPMQHDLQLDALSMMDTAMATLELLKTPWKLVNLGADTLPASLPGVVFSERDGGELVLKYANQKTVSSFLAFESVMRKETGVGCLRYDMGRASNVDLMGVGVPLVFIMKPSKIPGWCTFTVTFYTVHINGATGRPVFPHMKTGMLKQVEHRDKFVMHVRSILPVSHDLYGKKWHEMAKEVYELPLHVAVPDRVECDPDDKYMAKAKEEDANEE